MTAPSTKATVHDSLSLDRISARLGVLERLAAANCLTELKRGETCPEMKR